MPRKQRSRLVRAFITPRTTETNDRYPCQNYRAISTKRISSSSSVFCVHLCSDTDRTDFPARAHARVRVHSYTDRQTDRQTHARTYVRVFRTRNSSHFSSDENVPAEYEVLETMTLSDVSTARSLIDRSQINVQFRNFRA